MKPESYEEFKKSLKKIENDRRYFLLKRYWLVTYTLWASIITAVCFTVFVLTVTLYHRYKVSTYKQKDISFIADVTGSISVINKSGTEDIITSPGKEIPYNSKITVAKNSSCHLQITKGYFIHADEFSIFFITASSNLQRRKPTVTLFLKRGKIETVSYLETSDKEGYLITTPTAVFPVFNKQITVECADDKTWTKIKGETLVTPKTIFNYPGITDNQQITQVEERLLQLVLNCSEKNNVLIPKFMDIAYNDFFLISRILNSQQFDSVIQNQFFIEK
jgi:hypothetical protein